MKKLLRTLSRQCPLLLFSSVSLLAYIAMVVIDWRYGTLRAANTPRTIAWFGLAFFAYLGLLFWAEKRGMSLTWMWIGAILFRCVLLFTTPTLSDDVYRYLWDGHIVNKGVSPYAHAINAPELDYLDIPQRALANNPGMASPYLPAAQAVFFGVTAVFPIQPFTMQLAMIAFDLAAAAILARLLAMAALPPRRLLIYLWNPLVIVEVAHGAHIDAWMLLLALLAVYAALKKLADNRKGTQINPKIRVEFRPFLSPLFLALATLTKLLPVLLLPVLFWFWNWWQRIFYGLVLVLLLVPFGLQAGWGAAGELNGRGLFGALRIYSSQWKFNSGLFYWIELWLGKQGSAQPLLMAKGIAGFLFLLLLLVVWLLARTRIRTRPALRLMSAPLMGYVLLTPTLHPWYVLILLAFVPFLTPAKDESHWRWLFAAPWIYLSGALIFSYLTYLDPLNFGEREWVRRLEWLPTLLALFFAAVAFIALRRRRLSQEVC